MLQVQDCQVSIAIKTEKAFYLLFEVDLVAMSKSTVVSKTLREYSEVSTVHGVNYVFSKSLPLPDRLLWTLLTSVALFGASYWSVTAYNNWQKNLVTTTLKDAAMPVTSLNFSGVTICTSGLNMEAVTRQLMEDFTTWKKEENNTSVDTEQYKNLLQEFMSLKFEINDTGTVNIFDLLKAFHSPDPEKTIQRLSLLSTAIACAGQQRTKRSPVVSEGIGFIVFM